MKTVLKLTLTAFTVFLLPAGALAQSFSIDWYKIAGGGGTSTGGNYSLTGGFWSLISVVQTVGAPTLNISHSGNTVTVYWQDVSGWSLQQNNNLSLPANWSASGGVTTSGGTNYLNISSPTGDLFFRLQHP